MTVTIAKPDKYAKCICCGSSLCKQCAHQAAVKCLLRDDTEINWR